MYVSGYKSGAVRGFDIKSGKC